jgi:hypothetical protein
VGIEWPRTAGKSLQRGGYVTTVSIFGESKIKSSQISQLSYSVVGKTYTAIENRHCDSQYPLNVAAARLAKFVVCRIWGKPKRGADAHEFEFLHRIVRR